MLKTFSKSSLVVQFAVAGGLTLSVCAVLVGTFVTQRIEHVVVQNTANATALFMESFIAPISQDLARADTMPVNAKRALDEVFGSTPLGQRIVSYKIWKPGGLVVDASNDAIVGKVFPPTENLRMAWQGHVRAEFGDTTDI